MVTAMGFPAKTFHGPAAKALRQAAAISQTAAAAALGVSQPALSQWEAGRCAPTFAHAIAYAGLLGVDVDALTVPA